MGMQFKQTSTGSYPCPPPLPDTEAGRDDSPPPLPPPLAPEPKPNASPILCAAALSSSPTLGVVAPGPLSREAPLPDRFVRGSRACWSQWSSQYWYPQWLQLCARRKSGRKFLPQCRQAGRRRCQLEGCGRVVAQPRTIRFCDGR